MSTFRMRSLLLLSVVLAHLAGCGDDAAEGGLGESVSPNTPSSSPGESTREPHVVSVDSGGIAPPINIGVTISGVWSGTMNGTRVTADTEEPISDSYNFQISPRGFWIPDRNSNIELSMIGQTVNSSIRIQSWTVIEIQSRPDRLLLHLEIYREGTGDVLYQSTANAYYSFVALKDGETPDAALRRSETISASTRLYVQYLERTSSFSSGGGISGSSESGEIAQGIFTRT